MKKVVYLYILTAIMLLCVACGSDEVTYIDKSIATNSDAQADVIKAERPALTIDDYKKEKESWKHFIEYTKELGGEMEFPSLDMAIKSGKFVDDRLSFDELAHILEKCETEKEFVECIDSLNLTPYTITTYRNSVNKHYLLRGCNRFRYTLCITSNGRAIWDWNYGGINLGSSTRIYDSNNRETIISNIKHRHDIHMQDAKSFYGRIVKYIPADYSNITYPFAEGVVNGKVEEYFGIGIDELLRIKDSVKNKEQFISEFIKEMPVPDISCKMENSERSIDFYEGKFGEMYVEIENKGGERDVYIYVDNGFTVDKITYDELSNEKIKEIMEIMKLTDN